MPPKKSCKRSTKPKNKNKTRSSQSVTKKQTPRKKSKLAQQESTASAADRSITDRLHVNLLCLVVSFLTAQEHCCLIRTCKAARTLGDIATLKHVNFVSDKHVTCSLFPLPPKGLPELKSLNVWFRTSGAFAWLSLPRGMSVLCPQLVRLEIHSRRISLPGPFHKSLVLNLPNLQYMRIVGWHQDAFFFTAPRLKELVLEKCQLTVTEGKMLAILGKYLDDGSSCKVTLISIIVKSSFGFGSGSAGFDESPYLTQAVRERICLAPRNADGDLDRFELSVPEDLDPRCWDSISHDIYLVLECNGEKA